MDTTDLFCGIGGFHQALRKLEGKCVLFLHHFIIIFADLSLMIYVKINKK
jgi:hypothetical protein